MAMPNTVVTYVLDPAERAGRTFVQQFVVVLLAAGSTGLLGHQNWLLAVDSAGFAAVTSLLTSVLLFKLPNNLVVRAAKTFLQSFAGTLVAANVLSVAHADWKGALAVAVPTALAALVSGSVPSLIPPGVLAAAKSGDYQPGAVVDPSVELDENGNPVAENSAVVAGRHRAEA
jgi:hypothetical protein